MGDVNVDGFASIGGDRETQLDAVDQTRTGIPLDYDIVVIALGNHHRAAVVVNNTQRDIGDRREM